MLQAKIRYYSQQLRSVTVQNLNLDVYAEPIIGGWTVPIMWDSVAVGSNCGTCVWLDGEWPPDCGCLMLISSLDGGEEQHEKRKESNSTKVKGKTKIQEIIHVFGSSDDEHAPIRQPNSSDVNVAEDFNHVLQGRINRTKNQASQIHLSREEGDTVPAQTKKYLALRNKS
jgi:hypothetical protein